MSPMSDLIPPKRNAEATKTRILDAVNQVLIEQGIADVTVKNIAQTAGIDKALVYRYFGSLDELLEAYAAENDLWPRVDELVGDDRIAWLIMSPAERLRTAVKRLVEGLRKRPEAIAIIAGEAVSTNVLVHILKERRDEEGKKLFAALQVDQPHRNPRLHGTLSIILASAMQYLLAQSQKRPAYGGVPLASDQDWAYIDEVVGLICGRVLDAQ